MKRIMSFMIVLFLLSNNIVTFADEFYQEWSIGYDIVTLDADITDIIGGKNVKLNMSSEEVNGGSGIVGYKSYIKYTLDGSPPEDGEYYYYDSGSGTPKYQEYNNEINLTEAGIYTLRAIGATKSEKSEEYTTQIQIEKISTPDVIFENNNVTIRTNTDGATIYYTTDGNTPTLASAEYTEPICLEESTLIQAVAIMKGYASSDVAAEYIEIETKEEIFAECNICGEYFNSDEMLHDEYDNLMCQGCYDKLQNKDEEVFYIQCPYCKKTFEDNEDIYDEDGYAVCPYCEGLIDTSEEFSEETEIEFITSDWATEEVYEAYQNNLIPYEMLETALYKTISREEFAAVAVKLYENIVGEIPDVDIYDTPFTDCNYASEYNTYIAVAYELGITKGTSDTTFSPYDNISREQLATMLYRVINITENDKTYEFDVNNVRKFYDDSEISNYAKESVYFMAEYGIVKGVDGAHFAPLDTATKEQSILISVRCVNSLFKD